MRQGLVDARKVGIQVGPSRWITHLADALDKRAPLAMRLKRSNRRFTRIRMNLLSARSCAYVAKCGTSGAMQTGRSRFPRVDNTRAIDERESMGAAHDHVPRASPAIPVAASKPTHRFATIYSWFTEGFDTPDLIDAKALLDELTG